jgi:hypothetical protein
LLLGEAPLLDMCAVSDPGLKQDTQYTPILVSTEKD